MKKKYAKLVGSCLSLIIILMTATKVANLLGCQSSGQLPIGKNCVIHWSHQGMLKGFKWKHMGICMDSCSGETEVVYTESSAGSIEHCLKDLSQKLNGTIKCELMEPYIKQLEREEQRREESSKLTAFLQSYVYEILGIVLLVYDIVPLLIRMNQAAEDEDDDNDDETNNDQVTDMLQNRADDATERLVEMLSNLTSTTGTQTANRLIPSEGVDHTKDESNVLVTELFENNADDDDTKRLLDLLVRLVSSAETRGRKANNGPSDTRHSESEGGIKRRKRKYNPEEPEMEHGAMNID